MIDELQLPHIRLCGLIIQDAARIPHVADGMLKRVGLQYAAVIIALIPRLCVYFHHQFPLLFIAGRIEEFFRVGDGFFCHPLIFLVAQAHHTPDSIRQCGFVLHRADETRFAINNILRQTTGVCRNNGLPHRLRFARGITAGFVPLGRHDHAGAVAHILPEVFAGLEADHRYPLV